MSQPLTGFFIAQFLTYILRRKSTYAIKTEVNLHNKNEILAYLTYLSHETEFWAVCFIETGRGGPNPRFLWVKLFKQQQQETLDCGAAAWYYYSIERTKEQQDAR